VLNKKSDIEKGYEIAKDEEYADIFLSTKHPPRIMGYGSPVDFGLEYPGLALRGFYRLW